MHPERLGPYELVQTIAVGGMAEVHIAKVIGVAGFERYVAVKTIHPQLAEDFDYVEMLIAEAKLAVRLVHPNIAQTFDLGRFGGIYYMSMEYVDGVDVFRLLRRAEVRSQQLPFAACMFIVHEVATALDYAHSRCDDAGRPLGIVHRDVSPQNVMVSFDGVVKLVDFGIAKANLAARRATSVGVIKGKHYYMSPEQARGDSVDHRSDIYSAGILLYELITGQPLFVEGNIQLLLELTRRGVATPPSTLRADVPPALERVVMRALAPDPAERYQRANDLATELDAALTAEAPTYHSAMLAELVGKLFDVATEDSPAPTTEALRLSRGAIARWGDSIVDANSVIIDPPSTLVDVVPPAADRFANYELHELIGGSIVATVHRATRGAHGVALKRIAYNIPDRKVLAARFLELLPPAARMRHPNLVEILEIGRCDGVHFVVMELVGGVTFAKAMQRPHPPRLDITLALLEQLVAAIAAVHAAGLVHGGLTPANIFITREGGVKVADLGITRLVHGLALGLTAKLGYLAPEVIDGAEPDARADVFALGVIAWEAIAKRRLFNSRSYHALAQQVRSGPIAPPSTHNENCDRALDAIVLSALARDPAARATATEVGTAIASFAELYADRRELGDWANAPVTENLRGDDDGYVPFEPPPIDVIPAAIAAAVERPSRPPRGGTTEHDAPEPDILISIEEPSKVIELSTFLVDRPPPPIPKDQFDEPSKEMLVIAGGTAQIKRDPT